MTTMLILRGPPATGKTTYRKELVTQDWAYVNLDELREMFPGATERDIHKSQSVMLRYHMRNGNSVVIDNLNLNTRTTAHYESLAAEYGYNVEYKDFGKGLHWSVAVERDAQRQGKARVGRSVIIQSYMQAGLYDDPRRTCVIFDLDGTLADISHRVHFVKDLVPGQKKDWNSFFAGIPHDMPNRPIKALYDMVCAAENHLIFGKGAPEIVPILVSGRGNEYRRTTETWLEEHDIDGYFALFMRPFNDRREDSIIKRELYQKYVKPYFDTLFVVDDRDQVVNMWRSEGLTCLQCAEGNF